MSMLFIAIVLGIVATFIFFLGLGRGAIAAIRDADKPSEENDLVDEGGYAWTAITAVVASITIVTLAGVNAWFIYLGPLLAIGTAVGIGTAFIVGDRK